MPKLKFPIPLPIKGLEVDKPGEYIDNRGTPDCQDMEITRSEIGKRLGTVAVGASLGERVMAFGELQIGNLTYVVRIGPSKVELLDKNTNTWSDIAGSALTATIQDRIAFAFPNLSGNKIMVFTNGVDAVRKYTGTGNVAALGGSPPAAKFCIAFRDYLLLLSTIGGLVNFPQRVQWCDTGDPETWGSGNAGSVDLVDDGLDITGCGIFGGYVTVHKEGAIYLGALVTTSAIFYFERKNTGVGTCCHQTIQNLPTGEQIFLARDGIRIFNGVTAPLIDSPIMDEIRSSLNPQALNKSWSVIVKEKDEYWVAVPLGSQTTPDTVYKYNYRTGQVFKDSRAGITACGIYQKTTQVSWDNKTTTWDTDTTRWDDVIYASLAPTVIFGDSSGVTTERSPVNNDNGAAIQAYWVSKDYTAIDMGLGDDSILVRWMGLALWARGSSLKVEYSTDAGTTWATATARLALSAAYPSDSNPLQSWFDVVSTRIRFRFSNSTVGEALTFKQFLIECSKREMRR